jgi:UDP-galactopyranose mutase
MKYLVVGAGLSGCTLARSFADAGHTVHIIEKRDHIAGNCYDERDKNGILVNKYGAHLFHTNSHRVEEFVKRFSEWFPYEHKVIGRIGSTYFPIPVNMNTVNTLCGTELCDETDMAGWLQQNTIPCDTPTNSEQVALARVGPVLYEKIFKEYTYKQWAKYPEELDASVLERIPVRMNCDPNYFSDRFQALPKEGYTAFVAEMIRHPLITVSLETDYTHEMRASYDLVCYTGPIDHYFTGHEPLEYRSIRFETEYLDVDEFQPNSVVNYPSPDEPFTRIVEYKHFYKTQESIKKESSGKTTIVREYTVADGDPYYPVPTAKNREVYEGYRRLAQQETGVYFVGRLANYKYYNMDAAILNALEIADSLIQALALL